MGNLAFTSTYRIHWTSRDCIDDLAKSTGNPVTEGAGHVSIVVEGVEWRAVL